MNKYGENEAYFARDFEGENLYWGTFFRPIRVTKYHDDCWALIMGGKHLRSYPTQKLAKIALVEEVLGKLHDQERKLSELLKTLKDEEEKEIK